jgi:hypothetical protein
MAAATRRTVLGWRLGFVRGVGDNGRGRPLFALPYVDLSCLGGELGISARPHPPRSPTIIVPGVERKKEKNGLEEK